MRLRPWRQKVLAQMQQRVLHEWQMLQVLQVQVLQEPHPVHGWHVMHVMHVLHVLQARVLQLVQTRIPQQLHGLRSMDVCHQPTHVEVQKETTSQRGFGKGSEVILTHSLSRAEHLPKGSHHKLWSYQHAVSSCPHEPLRYQTLTRHQHAV